MNATLNAVALLSLLLLSNSCSKNANFRCGQDGVCIEIKNLSDYQIEAFNIGGVDLGAIEPGGVSSRHSIPLLYSHNNEVRFWADDVPFRTNWIVCGTGFEEYTSGSFTIALTISEFDLGYFSIELVREN